ncbi:MAG: hypothetical protein LBC37_05560 [Zoogloeaceae bacterium]|jgi:hypothetical protein|nr:hypothetical protein [Zoogloeaceae bacterium]
MGDTTSPSPKARKIYPAIITAAVFVFFCSQREGGIPARLLTIPFSIWALCEIVYAVRYAEDRKHRLLRVGVWFLAFALVIGMHALRDSAVRQEADAMVAKIQAYQEEHGGCPPTLEAIQESKESIREKLGRGGFYACQEGFFRLTYTVPSSGFDRYYYDSERKNWNFVPD